MATREEVIADLVARVIVAAKENETALAFGREVKMPLSGLITQGVGFVTRDELDPLLKSVQELVWEQMPNLEVSFAWLDGKYNSGRQGIGLKNVE